MRDGKAPGSNLQAYGEGDPPVPKPTTTSRSYLSPTDAYQFSPISSGIASSCGSLTEAATVETPMSRQSSNVFDNISGLGMLRLESHAKATTEKTPKNQQNNNNNNNNTNHNKNRHKTQTTNHQSKHNKEVLLG